MIISSTFHVSVFLMAVLVFSMPFVTIAQQTAEAADTKSAPGAYTKSEKESLIATAKADAERDAETDVNKLLWTGVGCAAPFFGLLGCFAGAHVVLTGTIESSGSGNCLNDLGNDLGSVTGDLIIGGGVGCLVGYSVPILPIYTYRLSPLPERLIGKSSEYVDFYTDAYKTKTQRLRGGAASTGALVGTGCLIGWLVLANVFDE